MGVGAGDFAGGAEMKHLRCDTQDAGVDQGDAIDTP